MLGAEGKEGVQKAGGEVLGVALLLFVQWKSQLSSTCNSHPDGRGSTVCDYARGPTCLPTPHLHCPNAQVSSKLPGRGFNVGIVSGAGPVPQEESEADISPEVF